MVAAARFSNLEDLGNLGQSTWGQGALAYDARISGSRVPPTASSTESSHSFTPTPGFASNMLGQIGIVNMLRTNDPYLDAMVMMLLPIVMAMLNSLFAQVSTYARTWATSKVPSWQYSRIIEYSTGPSDSFGSNNMQAQLLFNDVLGYLSKIGCTSKAREGRYKDYPANPMSTRCCANGKVIIDEADFESLVAFPVNDTWLDVPGYDIRACVSKKTQEHPTEKNMKTMSYVIEFTCRDASGLERIEKFIFDAIRYQVKRNSVVMPPNIYLHSEPGIFEKFNLLPTKQFSNLFLPEKNELVELIDEFTKHKGQFAVKGQPHKLGILLYGPPGTGKTSFMKALANHTNRNLIYVNLSLVRTTAELHRIITRVQIQMRGCTENMKHDKCIFVLEDIDCAGGDIVIKREHRDEKADPGPQQDMMGEMQQMIANSIAMAHVMNDKDKKSKVRPKDLSSFSSNPLDLGGILNVFDGLVETPGRIIIVTTNRPEQLDEAFIRPGRIDKIIHVGYMATQQASEMIRHYFPEEEEARVREIADKFGDKAQAGVSPATLEMCLVLSKSLDELCVALPRYSSISFD